MGPVAPTSIVIFHWVGCINTIKILFLITILMVLNLYQKTDLKGFQIMEKNQRSQIEYPGTLTGGEHHRETRYITVLFRFLVSKLYLKLVFFFFCRMLCDLVEFTFSKDTFDKCFYKCLKKLTYMLCPLMHCVKLYMLERCGGGIDEGKLNTKCATKT